MKALIAVCIAAILMAGCYGPGGPAQRTGRTIDHGAAKVGEAVEKTGEKIQETAQ
ncbi:MAG TPA: hypothetical protein VIT91_20265 [Chthoniobacterales bacterium]